MLFPQHQNNLVGLRVPGERLQIFFHLKEGAVTEKHIETWLRSQYIIWLMAHTLSARSFFPYLCILNENEMNGCSEEDVLSVMSYLCSWSKVHAVQIFPAETGIKDHFEVSRWLTDVPSEGKASAAENVEIDILHRTDYQVCESKMFTGGWSKYFYNDRG